RPVPRKIPNVVFRIQTEHGAAGGPAGELAGLGIVLDRSAVHANDDIALAVELQLVGATAGLTRTGVGAFATVLRAARFASCTLRDLEGDFLCFAGLHIDPAEHVGEVIGVVGVLVVHNDVMRPDEPPIAAEHEEFTLAPARQRVLGHDQIGGSGVGRPRPLLEWDFGRGAGTAYL